MGEIKNTFRLPGQSVKEVNSPEESAAVKNLGPKRPQDKRIKRTKKNIKETLIKLLQDKSFEEITVTEICEAGETSRITFYSHYTDKYALVEEMFTDYISMGFDEYHEIMKNSDSVNKFDGYMSLLDAILNLYFNESDFFLHANSEDNPYLYSAFYRHCFKSVEQYIVRHDTLIPKYSPRQTAAFLCNGVWSMINECSAMNLSVEQIRQDTRNFYQDILKSDIFMINDKNLNYQE